MVSSGSVNKGYIGDLGRSAYKPALVSGGIQVPIATGAKGNALPDTRFDGSKLNKNNYQCGEFVNDYLGKRVIGDTLASKRAVTPSQTPSIGAIFTMDVGTKAGHTGVVEKTAPDNSWIDIVDANRNNDHKIDRRRLYLKNGKYVDKGGVIDGFSSGLTKEGAGQLTTSNILSGLPYVNSTIPSTTKYQMSLLPSLLVKLLGITGGKLMPSIPTQSQPTYKNTNTSSGGNPYEAYTTIDWSK